MSNPQERFRACREEMAKLQSELQARSAELQKEQRPLLAVCEKFLIDADLPEWKELQKKLSAHKQFVQGISEQYNKLNLELLELSKQIC